MSGRSCEDQTFVLKHVPSKSNFEQSLKLEREFAKCNRLLLPCDYSKEARVLVFEQFKDDLRSFVKENKRKLSLKTIKQILFETGLAIKALHDKNWIHSGIKVPSRASKLLLFRHSLLIGPLLLDVRTTDILLDWRLDDKAEPVISKIALADLDSAVKLEGEQLIRRRKSLLWPHLGYISPAAPDAATLEQCISKDLDVFSFALVVSENCLITA